MKRLIWLLGLLLLTTVGYSQIDTIQNNEGGLSVRTKLNATIMQVNALTAGTATDSSFVSMLVGTINEYVTDDGVTIDGTLIKDNTIAPNNGNPAQYITSDADEISLYAGSSEILDLKSSVATVTVDFQPNGDGVEDLGGSSNQWLNLYTKHIQVSEQTPPSAPSANTGVIYMSNVDEHLYFQNSTTTFDLTTGTGGSTDSLWQSITVDSIHGTVWIEGVTDLLNDTVDLGEVAPLLVDTVPLLTFGGGANNTGDGVVFTTDAYYGTIYIGGSDTLVITELMGVVEGSSASVGVQINWHSDHGSGSAITLNSSAFTVNSTTTGSSDVSFANNEIPPGVFVWCTTPTVTAAPIYMSITLMGWKK